MDREDLDRLSQDLLGRPLTAAEYLDLLRAMTALRLGPGSPVVILLILYLALRSQVTEAMMVGIARRAHARRVRLASLVLGVTLATACAGLGLAVATQQLRRDLDGAARWAISEEGQRARRMSDSGLLATLDACSIPGWRSEPPGCFPGPDPASGLIQGLRTR